MDYRDICFDSAEAIATITLNRPDRLNAWTIRMGNEVRHAVLTAERDPDIRVIIVTGAGRGYCAGADMQMLQGLGSGGELAAASGPAVEASPTPATTPAK